MPDYEVIGALPTGPQIEVSQVPMPIERVRKTAIALNAGIEYMKSAYGYLVRSAQGRYVDTVMLNRARSFYEKGMSVLKNIN